MRRSRRRRRRGATATNTAKDEVHVLTSTRILARRRLGTTGAAPHVTAPPRRRRRTRGFVQVAGSVAAERLRLNVFGHAYVGVGAVVIVVLFYRALASRRPGRVERVGSARLRVVSMLLVAVVLAGMVWTRLAYWQVAQHGQLTLQAQAQYRELVELPALRGAIFDRNLTQLVVNTTVYSAFISPDQVASADRDRVATGLASVLGVDKANVMTTLASKSKFAYVQRRLAKAKADQLRALKLPGVGLQEETQRAYLPGIASGTTLAANLLGFVDWSGKGNYGLEEKYQQVLAGTPGYISSYRDLANREIVLGSHTHQDPINGQDLVLSVDANIQYAAEQALADGVKRDKAESGSVLIMDPNNGGIVAWADYPSYNANDFNHTDPAPFKDNIVGSLY